LRQLKSASLVPFHRLAFFELLRQQPAFFLPKCFEPPFFFHRLEAFPCASSFSEDSLESEVPYSTYPIFFPDLLILGCFLFFFLLEELVPPTSCRHSVVCVLPQLTPFLRQQAFFSNHSLDKDSPERVSHCLAPHVFSFFSLCLSVSTDDSLYFTSGSLLFPVLPPPPFSYSSFSLVEDELSLALAEILEVGISLRLTARLLRSHQAILAVLPKSFFFLPFNPFLGS